jgi:CHAT domain-containing protein
VGKLEESLGSVLDAIDELTEGIRRHISGTEQAARRGRFAEVEALLDRSLQIVSQDPLAFAWAAIERLWELLIQYRDIDLEFNDSILRLHRAGVEGPIASYRETRDLLAALELDGCARLPGQSDAAAIGLYARLTLDVRHTLYNTEITLSESPSYTESIRRRLQTRLPDILAQLRENEMLVEFVDFWSGMMANGVGLRSLMAFAVSATTPQRLLVIADRRTRPSRELVVQTLLDLDLQPSESIDLPVGETDLAWALVHHAEETRVKRLLCVPDGPVKLMNVAALPYAEGRLADHVDIAYLGHAADLLLEPSSTAAGPSAVFGDAEFDQPLSQSEDTCVNDGRAPMQFPELPATAAEADWVAGQLRVSPTTRDKATAATFRALRSPLVLHVATHGVFDEGYALPSLAATGGHDYGTFLRATAAYPRLAPERPMDPALRSGVAFTGINWWLRGLPRGDDNECGYISAYDISWMDLTGTRLAVFSGCRTGRGPDERYLGLVDLRRAVRTAGAWEFIAAIWSVPDTASALLMHLMYSCAEGPVPTAEDLGRAQRRLRHATVADVRSWLAQWPAPPTFGGPYLREVLRQPDDYRPFADPYYWAGFVCYTSGRARQPARKGREPDGRHSNEHQPTHIRGVIQRRLRARRPAADSEARRNLDAAGPGT